MRKLTRMMTVLAVAGSLSFGLTALDSRPAQADLHKFEGFDETCDGECPIDAGDGDCCSVAPPIIVDVPPGDG